MAKIEKTINSAIEEFNKYHSPEVHAELANVNKEFAIIKFNGPACSGCGAYDYFEDLRIEVENTTGKPFNILKIDEDGSNFLVKFDLKWHKG